MDLLAGLPLASLDQVVRDLNRVSELGPQEIQLETVKVLPGTPLAEQTTALGLVHAPTPPYEVLRTPHVSYADLEAARALARVIDQYYNHARLRAAVRAAAATDAGFYSGFARFLSRRYETDAPAALEHRFRRLHEYLAQVSAGEAQAILEQDWIRCGLSAAQGLRPATPWHGALPAAAVLTAGDAQACARRNARIWLLTQAAGERWFVFDRSAPGPGPLAEFARKAAGPEK